MCTDLAWQKDLAGETASLEAHVPAVQAVLRYPEFLRLEDLEQVPISYTRGHLDADFSDNEDDMPALVSCVCFGFTLDTKVVACCMPGCENKWVS